MDVSGDIGILPKAVGDGQVVATGFALCWQP